MQFTFFAEAEFPNLIIFSKTGDQGNEWNLFQTAFQIKRDWYLVLEHKTAGTFLNLGNVAVDDITIRKLGAGGGFSSHFSLFTKLFNLSSFAKFLKSTARY